MSNKAKPSSSATATSLTTFKETLENMLQALQEELRKVDSEWTQMCSIVDEKIKEKQNETSPAFEKCIVMGVADGALDDPLVVNDINLQL